MSKVLGFKITAFLGFILWHTWAVQGQDIVYGNFGGYNVHRLTTPHGYIDLGPKNTSWAHIYSDRPRFIFNKPIYALNGVFGAYQQVDLNLQTNGISRLTIAGQSGHVTIRKFLLVDGADFRLGLNSGRDKGQNTAQRAMVHYTSDRLFLNFAGDFEGGVVVQGPKTTFDELVGIGTNNPQAKLEISYNVEGAPSNSTGLIVRNNAGGNLGQAEIKLIPAVPEHHWSISANDERNLFRLFSGSTPRFAIDGATGNVGIGTTNPTEELSVNGTIRSKEIICEVAPWPDYVFESDYALKPLEDLAVYIEKEGHLPNIPSAEEVHENGVTLAKMNALLLEKIEELTLYTLQQQQQLETQQAQIEQLLKAKKP